MNEKYIKNFDFAESFVGTNDSAACSKFKLLIDIIDFDGITNIVDFGCRFAENSIEMSILFPNATVHGIEPVPESYAICCEKHETLSSDIKNRIHLYNFAVSNKSEPITFYVGNDPAVSSKYNFIPNMNGTWWGKGWEMTPVTVMAMTLDDWKTDHNIGPIDVMWVDVQGGELDAFMGAVQTLKDVKIIMTEMGTTAYYEGQSLRPEINSYLNSQGFEELPNSWVSGHPYEGDVIYIRK